MTDDDILAVVLRFEGGFVNNSADRGGPTNMGVTASTLGIALRLGRPATVDEVRSMTRETAVGIYRARYIHAPRFDRITNGGLRLVVVDSGVLHGTARAARWLQSSLGLTVDGSVGGETIRALATHDNAKVARAILATRIAFFDAIVARDPSQRIFLKGWLARIDTLMRLI